MRLFLAFDTATDHLALALGDLDAPGKVVAATDFSARRAANTAVLGAAEQLLEGAGAEPGDLQAVAIGRGPGSFTGVRIGVASAKGLAHGLGVPLVGFGTLDAVAERCAASEMGVQVTRRAGGAASRLLIGVLGDAMRGEVYPALFSLERGTGTQTLRRLTQDRVASTAAVATEWAALGEPLTLSGNALAKHGDFFAKVLGERASLAPERLWPANGEALVAAAWRADGPSTIVAIAGEGRDRAMLAAHPAVLLPVYTRLADAEEAERLRIGSPDRHRPSGVAGPPASSARRPADGSVSGEPGGSDFEVSR